MKRTTAAAVVLMISLLIVPIAAAQSDQTTSTTTDPPVSSSSVPDESSSTVSTSTVSTTSTTIGTSVSTTTTTVYLPPPPPELADDPRLPYLSNPDANDGLEIPIAQRSFDPLSVGVLPDRVAESQLVLAQSLQTLAAATSAFETRSVAVSALESRVGELADAAKVAVKRAARARQRLRDHALIAYTRRRSDPRLSIVEMADATDVGVAKQYLDVLMDNQDHLIREYDEARRSLSSENADLADRLGVERSKLSEDSGSLEKARETVRVAREQLAAYEAGAHAYIAGFVFPVASQTEFIDSWGYPRMMGTPSAHWHQGTDIFATYGAPVIASENGVIDRLGQASLGGNKLWVKGDSGTAYYYAHLSAFADGMVGGKRVRAGEVVGYVGDTGNAKGTSPHLHFEVHPLGGEPVNAYPLLRAAYGNRPVFRAVAPTTTLPTESVPTSTSAEVAGG